MLTSVLGGVDTVLLLGVLWILWGYRVALIDKLAEIPVPPVTYPPLTLRMLREGRDVHTITVHQPEAPPRYAYGGVDWQQYYAEPDGVTFLYRPRPQ